MSMQSPPLAPDEIEYPDCDGEPMSDNTLQFQWIMVIVGNLQALFRNVADVFVAGDLLWYPVEGDNVTRTAPDGLVAFGRPKGYRGSYMQWKEAGIAPQVVFEILSPGNRLADQLRKFSFYDRFGVEEYYVYDPDRNLLRGWLRSDDGLNEIPSLDRWVSPRLRITFTLTPNDLVVSGPDGLPFATFEQLAERAEQASERAEQEAERAQQEAERAEQQARRNERLVAQLRALGIEPEV